MKSTERLTRSAPTPVLERTVRLYAWVARVSFLAVPTCLLLGTWVDWRWLPTALLPALSWVIAHLVLDHLAAELDRRRKGGPECPDRLG